jgi:hypothetical protein
MIPFGNSLLYWGWSKTSILSARCIRFETSSRKLAAACVFDGEAYLVYGFDSFVVIGVILRKSGFLIVGRPLLFI